MTTVQFKGEEPEQQAQARRSISDLPSGLAATAATTVCSPDELMQINTRSLPID